MHKNTVYSLHQYHRYAPVKITPRFMYFSLFGRTTTYSGNSVFHTGSFFSHMAKSLLECLRNMPLSQLKRGLFTYC